MNELLLPVIHCLCHSYWCCRLDRFNLGFIQFLHKCLLRIIRVSLHFQHDYKLHRFSSWYSLFLHAFVLLVICFLCSLFMCSRTRCKHFEVSAILGWIHLNNAYCFSILYKILLPMLYFHLRENSIFECISNQRGPFVMLRTTSW